MSDENNGRVLPQSELDFNLMTTDPVWGSDYISPELKKMMTSSDKTINEEGGVQEVQRNLWSYLAIFTRDYRLANLSKWDGDLSATRWWLEYAHISLLDGDIENAAYCLGQVASYLELSQSKGGFLRKRMHTLTSENINRDNEPPKRGLFGQKKRGSDE